MLQSELHRHLDVCTRLSTLHELALLQGLIPRSSSLAAFARQVLIVQPMGDLREVLQKFSIYQRVLTTPEILARIAFEAVEDCYLEGTRQVELRYAPPFVSEFSQLPWAEALAGLELGIARACARYPEMRVGLICIATRDYGVDAVAETVAFCLSHREHFIGFDLAGNEQGFPCRSFEEAFRPLRQAGVPITIHSGEACGPENIWEALELLGARRIGHGITCVQDPMLVRHLIDRGICLEMCPTSNVLTRSVPCLEQHPLPELLRAGVAVTLNADDPGIFALTLPMELELARDKLALSEQEVRQCLEHAIRHTFLPTRVSA